MLVVAFVFVIFLLDSARAAATSTITTTVNAPSGTFVGQLLPGNLRLWKVIPYGVADRFKNPKPYPNQNIFDSNSAKANVCYQSDEVCRISFPGSGYCDNQHYSEDCLNLKLTAPPVPSNRTLYPVMIWIHGGSFQYGDGYAYNGTAFAKKGVIVVSINYRLGLFGYLAGSKGSNLDGNYGFMDQRLAMQWVQNNIKAFGGDPTKVTLAGQSAGAMSVGAHLISPGSQRLFRSVAMLSNALSITYTDRTIAYDQTIKIFNAIKSMNSSDPNCKTFKTFYKCVQTIEPSYLINAVQYLYPAMLPITPLVDPDGEIPDQPYAALSAGKFPPNISILSGVTRDEGIIFVYSRSPVIENIEAFHSFLLTSLGSNIAPLLPYIDAYYPFQNKIGFDGRILASQIFTDIGFICPLLKMLSSITPNRRPMASYIYNFIHPYSTNATFYGSSQYCTNAVCHAFELPYIFQSLNSLFTNNYIPTAAESRLAKNINTAWVNFITTKNPNKNINLENNIKFLAYNATSQYMNMIDIGTQTITGPYSRYPQCVFWNSINPYPVSVKST